METGRLFAVIPAAGLSRRMGRPKLQLQLGGRSVLHHLLDGLVDARISDRLVVIRESDEPLRNLAQQIGVAPVLPSSDPPDMRMSVQIALNEIQARQTDLHPDHDAWLLIPADHPVVNPALVTGLIDAWNCLEANVDGLVPVFKGRSGHPCIFRWRVANLVEKIPADQGLNWLKRSGRIQLHEWVTDDPSTLLDLDTPDDWARLQRDWATNLD